MAEVIPAVLPKNYEDLKNKIALVRGVVPVVQIDICDGVFVKNMTWPFMSRAESLDSEFLENDFDLHFRRILNEEEGLPFWEDIDFELDLMVLGAVENFDVYTKLGARRLVFHVEAVGDLEEFKNFLEGIDSYVRDVVEIGLAINTTTPVETIFPMISNVDFVQVMGIENPGFQGEEFDERCLEHIKTLKEKYSDLVISVDGAVDLETAPLLVDAGATRLVSGSAIFNSDDILSTVEEFKQI